MIPLILELKNFLSYGEQIQTIDFTNYSLICLSGKNGNGKSALLDAITWALWGQARKIMGAGKADEGLLRLGQTRMMVSLTFQNGPSRYRVRREFAKTYGKPYSALDLELFDQEKNTSISLTDKTIRQTQEKLESLIGLDYETFVNAAFLRQGQANEFSKKTPKERKNILAAILGLTQYDELQQAALEHTRTKQEEKKRLIISQEQVQQELLSYDELIKTLEITNKHYAGIAIKLTKIQEQKDLIQQQVYQKEQLVREFKELTQAYNNTQQHVKAFITDWKKTHAMFLKLPDNQTLRQQQRELSLQEQKLLTQQQDSIKLQEKILNIKDELAQKQMIIQKELQENILQAQKKHQEKSIIFQHKAQTCTQKELLLQDIIKEKEKLHKQLQEFNTRYKEKITHEETLTKLIAQFEKRKIFYQTYAQKGNWINAELKEFAHKKNIVHDLGNPACPLCEQVLTIKRKQFLASKLKSQELKLAHQFKRITFIVQKLKDILIEQNIQIQNDKKILEDFNTLHNQQAQKQKDLQENTRLYENLTNEISILTNEYQILAHETQTLEQALTEREREQKERLNKDPEVIRLQKELKQVEKEFSTRTINPQAIIDLQQQRINLETLIQAHSQQQDIQNEQTERRSSIKHLLTGLKQQKQTLVALTEQLQENPLETLAQTHKHLQQEYIALSQEKEKLVNTVGQLENTIKRLETIKKDHEKTLKIITLVHQDIEDYQLLAQALSKNGIQALLIEQALPEIEQEANNLLGKLTDNQTHIFIESLRDLKSGGTKETLDIQISDTMGIRPYEMYSGGEAFRVDFALRIALSKLLTRRAGASLSTLIIDEGFGSQDEDGLARMMEVIYAISQDFSKIIVVSHLTEFKDNFPVHFIVDKGETGSSVHIEERG